MKSAERFSMRRASLLLIAVLFAACSSPTAPSERPTVFGRLAGVVTIGPNCPVEQPGSPCPTPPSAYSLRKILVYNEQRTTLLHTVDIDNQGLYAIDLAPARYLVDIKGVGIDRSSDVPKVVEIHANTVTPLNISIDTGLR
jgi:hypothetical protein